MGANTTAEQILDDIDDLKSSDTIISVSRASHQAGLGIVGWRVHGDKKVAVTFSNSTSAPVTPPPSGYTVLALRT
ncbi:hypothetical protein WME91_53445 [Sorangium sp. So ce269]